MSGHSKWATIKHKKGAKDAKRGKLFNKLARQLEVAAREGGGDPTSNATLRTTVLKAKAGQMTNDAIDRAIKRGTGGDDGGTYEAITYEGYAPGGVAILVDTLTDNRNRTGSDVRNIFSKLGGSMAEPGAVSWQFSRKGVILVDGCARRGRRDAGRARRRRRRRRPRRRRLARRVRAGIVYDLQAALEAAGIEREVGREHDGVVDRRSRSPTSGDAREDPADHGCLRGQRRRAGRVQQLRHLRRADGSGRHVSVGIGDRAPDFTLSGTGGEEYSLADYSGQPVVLVFYPGDDTPVCTKQLNSYNDDLDQFERRRRPGARHLRPGRRQPRQVQRQARLPVPAARRHGQVGRRPVRHARPARLPSAQRVRHRRRGRHPLRPPRHRRPHLPPRERAGRSRHGRRRHLTNGVSRSCRGERDRR